MTYDKDGGIAGSVDVDKSDWLSIQYVENTDVESCPENVLILYADYIDEDALGTALEEGPVVTGNIDFERDDAAVVTEAIKNTSFAGIDSAVFAVGEDATLHQTNMGEMNGILDNIYDTVTTINSNSETIKQKAHDYNTKLSLLKNKLRVRLLQKKCNQINTNSENAAQSGGDTNRISVSDPVHYTIINGEGYYPMAGWESYWGKGVHQRKYHKLTFGDIKTEGIGTTQTITDVVSTYWWIEYDSFFKSNIDSGIGWLDEKDAATLEGWITETGNELPYDPDKIIERKYEG